MGKNSMESVTKWAVVCESTDSGIPVEDIVSTHPTEVAALEMAQSLNMAQGCIYEPFEGGRDMPPYHIVRELGTNAFAEFLGSQQPRQAQVESVDDDLSNLCDNCGAPKNSSYCCGQDY